MTDRPAPIRVTDLADPGFSADAKAKIDAMSALAPALRLEPEPLCAQAIAETGLRDFGDQGFRDRLALLARAFREEADLSPAGVVMVYGQIVAWLKNRLLMQDLLKDRKSVV